MRAEKNMIMMPALIMIALSITGVAVAHWSDSIQIEGTVQIASMALVFDNLEPPICTEFHKEYSDGPLVLGELYGVDVGRTVCSCQDSVMDTMGQGYETMVVEIQNAYPSYLVHCVFFIHNIGTIPADICEFIVTDPTGVLTWNPDLSALVDGEGDPIIHILYTSLVGEQVNPGDKVKAEFKFHIAQDAEEGRTYSFEIAIAYTQWEQTMENSQVPLVTNINIVVDNDWANDEQVKADVGGNFTWGANAFAKIQDAINSASPNDNILVYPGTYNEDVTVDVENLTLIGVGGPVLDASGYDFGFSVQATGVTIDNFAVMNANKWGIEVCGGDIEGGSVTIRNNSISNKERGIYFCSSIVNSEVRIAGNTIDNNGIDGICFYSSIVNSEVGITGNTIDNNGHQGILFVGGIENSVVGITGNTVDNNGLTGIHSHSSIVNSEVGITGNTVDNNNNNGICIKVGIDAMRIKVNHNNIVNNTAYGVNNPGTGTLNATQNWWGDNSGPYHPDTNPDGLGDNVSNNVNYTPWLDAPHQTGW